MNRKKFFAKFSIAVLGLTIVKSNPLASLKGKSVSDSNLVKVKVNKLAVKRKETGLKNV
jgi:hypothetical protein